MKERKEEKLIFLRVSMLVLVILLIHVGFYVLKFSAGGITGFSIKETLNETYTDMTSISKIFLVAEWVFLTLLLIFVFIKDKGIKINRKELSGINIKSRYGGTKTDLDVLYDVLKEKKKLKISNVARIFNVSEKLANEWCRTLELNNLALIDYPRVGEPEIRIV